MIQQIRPIIIGELICQDTHGTWRKDFAKVYFLAGINDKAGTATAIIHDETSGTILTPVRKVHYDSSGAETISSEPLIYEGFAGLTCTYDKKTGTIKNFRE